MVFVKVVWYFPTKESSVTRKDSWGVFILHAWKFKLSLWNLWQVWMKKYSLANTRQKHHNPVAFFRVSSSLMYPFSNSILDFILSMTWLTFLKKYRRLWCSKKSIAHIQLYMYLCNFSLYSVETDVCVLPKIFYLQNIAQKMVISYHVDFILRVFENQIGLN